MKKVEERFLEYIKIDTKSDETTKVTPSTKGQLEFGKVLASELKNLGLSDVKISNDGYIYATLDGNLDKIDPRALPGLDYLIASLHTVCIEPSTKEDNTKAILNAMEQEKVKIIGHPDDSRYPLDYEAIVKRAKEKNILLEVNNSSLSPDTSREGTRENVKTYLELCKKYGVRIIMGTDSHICYDIGIFTHVEQLIEEINFPKELVINYWEDQIIEFFGI